MGNHHDVDVAHREVQLLELHGQKLSLVGYVREDRLKFLGPTVLPFGVARTIVEDPPEVRMLYQNGVGGDRIQSACGCLLSTVPVLGFSIIQARSKSNRPLSRTNSFTIGSYPSVPLFTFQPYSATLDLPSPAGSSIPGP